MLRSFSSEEMFSSCAWARNLSLRNLTALALSRLPCSAYNSTTSSAFRVHFSSAPAGAEAPNVVSASMVRPILIRYAPRSSPLGSYSAFSLACRLDTLAPPLATEDGRGLLSPRPCSEAADPGEWLGVSGTGTEAGTTGKSAGSSSSPSDPNSSARPSPYRAVITSRQRATSSCVRSPLPSRRTVGRLPGPRLHACQSGNFNSPGVGTRPALIASSNVTPSGSPAT